MRFIKDKSIKFVLFLCGFLSVIITGGIFVVLLTQTIAFFNKVSIVEFFTSDKWTPLLQPQNFGIAPLVSGTFLIVFFACLIALPIGLCSAIYLSEYANSYVRKIIKPIIEILSGVPSIVYGFFALNFITPMIQKMLPQTSIYNALSASLAVGIMIIPMVLSMSEDSMHAVPKSMREGAYALGFTKFEVVTGVVLPASASGIIASFILAISRAIGETMIVALAAGSNPKLTLNPLDSIQTMTGYIVQISQGDIAKDSLESQTLFAVAMMLFLITLIMNCISGYVADRLKEEY